MGDFRPHRFDKKHETLSKLKKYTNVNNNYLQKTGIPSYPKSVLFRISRLSHVTGESGLYGIIKDCGFCKPDHTDNFIWWSLSVTENELASAQSRFLRWSYGDEDPDQPPFLEKFTTSPAFQSASRYGNFRFTFPFRKLLRKYSEQFCFNSAPVLRVLRTELYQQEILYSVLVHPPDVRAYDEHPRLPVYPNQGVCGYRFGRAFWLCQSPSNAYDHELRKEEGLMQAKPLFRKEYYVWDHMAVAFHMEAGWTLHVDRDQLFRSVSTCNVTEPYLLKKSDTPRSKKEAEKILHELKST